MIRFLLLILSIVVVAASTLSARQDDSQPVRQETSNKGSATSESESPSLEDLEELSVPSEPHELLATTVGTWDVRIRIWSDPDPEAEPASETQGTAVGRWILGERFVETTYKGEVLGRPFEGLKIEGFDKAEEKYVSTWRDNLGTYTLVFKGICEDSCVERTMTASFLDPVSKGTFRVKGVTTISGEDTYTYESFVITPNGKEFKNMELDAKRRN